MGTDKRRLEMVEGSSSKFWEVAIDGASYTVTYGRIGTPGVSKTNTAGSAAEAQAEVAKLVKEKLKKGYQEIGGEVTWRPPAPIGWDEHVERFMNYKVVAFNPDAEGEGDEGRRELKALRELDKLVFAVAITYDDGEGAFARRLDALLADPKVGELRGLVIGNWFGEDPSGEVTAVLDRLAKHGAKLKALKGLFVGDVLQ